MTRIALVARKGRGTATGGSSKHRVRHGKRGKATRFALTALVVAGFAALVLVLVHGGGSNRTKSEVDFHVSKPTPSPAVTQTPLMKYRAAETTDGILYAGVQDGDINAAVADTCYNSLAQMKQYVHTTRLFNKINPGKYRDTLLDHALFISAYCPGERLEYDRAVRDEAPGVVTLPPAD